MKDNGGVDWGGKPKSENVYEKKIYFNYKYFDCTIPLSWFQIEVFDPIGAIFFFFFAGWERGCKK